MVGLDTNFIIKELLLAPLSQKCTKKIISMVDHILQDIQDLNNQTNDTNRGLLPLILKEYLKMIDGTSMNT